VVLAVVVEADVVVVVVVVVVNDALRCFLVLDLLNVATLE